jgi:hypothetical protein
VTGLKLSRVSSDSALQIVKLLVMLDTIDLVSWQLLFLKAAPVAKALASEKARISRECMDIRIVYIIGYS